jgi:5-methyltetrahydrofolate--homocysteine methyltransferase
MTRDERIAALWARLRTDFLICDGAMGTTLSAAGHGSGESLDLYAVERPDLVRAAHRAYLEAGAEVIETNTFQASSVALAHYGLGARAREINLAAAARAREAAGEGVPVAGCIGPTGGILEPYGDLEPAAAQASFEEQAQALADGGVDFLIVETFTALEEVRLAIAAAAATDLPVAASMAFDPNGHTVFGVTPQQAAAGLAEAGAEVVGANCGTVSPDDMIAILAHFREATDLPLIAQPNAGRPQRTGDVVIFPEPPETFAEAAPRFRALGARIIGGCCGTTPAHIRAVAGRLRTAGNRA